MPIGNKERSARESGRKPRVELGIGQSGQAMGSSHLIPMVQEWPPALGVIADQIPDLTVGIPVQEIERTQVRPYRPKPIERSLGPGVVRS